jgi:hypothetical protein
LELVYCFFVDEGVQAEWQEGSFVPQLSAGEEKGELMRRKCGRRVRCTIISVGCDTDQKDVKKEAEGSCIEGAT